MTESQPVILIFQKRWRNLNGSHRQVKTTHHLSRKEYFYYFHLMETQKQIGL